MLIQNEQGNFSFLKGISPYSAGAVAMRGYEIEHARLQPMRSLKEGFEVVERHLKSLRRPRQALCGMELRIPHAFTFQGFSEFNAGYVEVLKRWDVLRDGLNPVARTNVAPERRAPSEPSLYGFSYTVPAREAPTTFVVAGAGELPEASLDPQDVVRRGETSTDALREKAHFVMGLMYARLRGLGVDWFSVTTTEVYTIHPICPLMEQEILQPMGAAAAHGITWHYARPPIVTIEYEMDLRGVRREIVL
jgi:hypothetical protein